MWSSILPAEFQKADCEGCLSYRPQAFPKRCTGLAVDYKIACPDVKVNPLNIGEMPVFQQLQYKCSELVDCRGGQVHVGKIATTAARISFPLKLYLRVRPGTSSRVA